MEASEGRRGEHHIALTRRLDEHDTDGHYDNDEVNGVCRTAQVPELAYPATIDGPTRTGPQSDDELTGEPHYYHFLNV